MNWQRVDQYHLKSDCGRYSIAKVLVDGWIKYEAFELGKPSKFLAEVGVKADAAEDARAAAVDELKTMIEARSGQA